MAQEKVDKRLAADDARVDTVERDDIGLSDLVITEGLELADDVIRAVDRIHDGPAVGHVDGDLDVAVTDHDDEIGGLALSHQDVATHEAARFAERRERLSILRVQQVEEPGSRPGSFVRYCALARGHAQRGRPGAATAAQTSLNSPSTASSAEEPEPPARAPAGSPVPS